MLNIVVLTNFLGLFSWSFPLVVLTYLAFYIEARTKFKTKWRWFLVAAILSFVQPIVLARDYSRYGNSLLSHLLVIHTLLCTSLLVAVYSIPSILKFQNIGVGRTKNTVIFLISVGLFVPIAAYSAGMISTFVALDLMLYNTSITAMVFIYLAIGKISRKYLPEGDITYALARAGSIILLVDAFARNYTYIFTVSLAEKYLYRLVGNLSQFTASILLAVTSFMLVNEARTRGIHILPSLEKIRGITAEYRLKSGHGYLVSEDGDKAVNIFVDYIANRYQGLCITRVKPADIREKYGIRTTPMLWLTNVETDEKSVKPTDLLRLKKVIEDFIDSSKKPIVLIQRLDYLVAQNDFKSVLVFIQNINDVVVSSDSILIASVDRSTLSSGEYNLIKQELTPIGDSEKITMPADLYGVLEFIHSENNLNRSPSFKDVGSKLDVTKATVRSRIHELERRGLLRVQTEGRHKLIELTERGRAVILAAVLKTGER